MTIKSILRRSFVNPFSIILVSLAAISFVTDVLFASNFSRNFSTFIILLTMYFVSAVIRLVQELKSKRTADFLAALVETDVTVWRDGQWGQTSSTELRPGDKILLEAGAKIPSSVKLATASDFYISESAITGESDIFEKFTGDICRAGSIVVGGKAEGIIENQKNEERKLFTSAHKNQSFDRGASSIAKVLLRFAVILIPLVFAISFTTKGDLLRSFLFALSVGVGLMAVPPSPSKLALGVAVFRARSFRSVRRDKLLMHLPAAALHVANGGKYYTFYCPKKIPILKKEWVFFIYILSHKILNV